MDPQQVDTELEQMVPGLDFRAAAVSAHWRLQAEAEAKKRAEKEALEERRCRERDARDALHRKITEAAQVAFSNEMDGASWRMVIVVDPISVLPDRRVKVKFVIDRIEIRGECAGIDHLDSREAWAFSYVNRQFRGLAGLGSLIAADEARHAAG